MRKYILMAIASLILVAGGLYFYLSRPDVAKLSVADLEGREPKFTAPRNQAIPTIGIAKAVGWSKDGAPVAAKGLKVNRFTDGLDHPRNLYVLPNGDVLVAETNSPPREGGGVPLWPMPARTVFGAMRKIFSARKFL